MTGILLVDKPEGTSSAGAIRALKPRLGRTKVGHLGTLDPFASGLLPLCLGEATKVARYLLCERKAYTGVIRLGITTDTLDRTGQPTATAAVPALEATVVEAIAARFVGRQHQVPPMFSALKRAGVPLYKLARQGIEVERAPRDIEIFALSLAPRPPDRLAFALTCSKGTYVRVLAADVGRTLGTLAHLEELRRTTVGSFRVEDAAPLGVLTALPAAAPLPLVPVRRALAELPAFAASADDVARLRRGQQAPLARLPPPAGPDAVGLVLDPGGDVAAVVEADGPRWKLVRLLGAA